MSRIAALIVAAGSGRRAGGGQPKQYRAIGGVPMIRRTVQGFRALPAVSHIQVVIGAGQEEEARKALAGLDLAPPAAGGDTRQESVLRGLQALGSAAPEFVLIHDAARPLVSAALIQSVIDSLAAGAEAVLPVLPAADSLRRLSTRNEWEPLERERVYRAQTPQGFRFVRIRQAHERFAGSGVTDDIALAERAGMKVTAVAGEETNIKITTSSDFHFAERMLAGAGEARTGFGYDVHRFVPGDHVWLCGVRVPNDHGLDGHSDADAGLHALTDAILGALAAGDIGQHFPPTDEKWRGVPSRVFLGHAADMVRQAGGAIVHCDVTLICEQPKIGPHRDAMRATIAGILALDMSRVSVKATTTEGLGFTGRGEGLAAQAVASIRLPG
jgi:2-C-methyl-D-erythritol 4-phosphate cytidylyltransferase/2-C-methyl-D-erythritol 2,4-cyclodiphosphate synthase